MAFIHFTKEQLHNSEFSMRREFLLANETGSYCSSSIVACNTRRYHGLLVVPQPHIDDKRYVLLSLLDETLLQGTKKFHLATHRYPNVFHPEGYYYLQDFSIPSAPQWIIRANDIELKKEILLMKNEDRLLLRYTVIHSRSPFSIQFDPFLSFRSNHSLGKANDTANRRSEKIDHGIKLSMYPGFTPLYIQLSGKPEFVPAPDWHYNNEYIQENERGYDFSEDLFCPGHFKVSLNRGDQLVVSAGLSEISSSTLRSLFNSQLKTQTTIEDVEGCLKLAAKQFISRHKKESSVTAGFHWFGRWGRDTFIALPGLTLHGDQPKICKAVIDSMLKEMKQGLFPNTGSGTNAVYNTADASLWFFWALQQYAIYTQTQSKIWREYGSKMRSVLAHYRKGTAHHIHMEENGLLHAGEAGSAVTWMDAVVDGKPVTPRVGLAVELNALWYNAICFAIEVATLANDTKFVNDWIALRPTIEWSFVEYFWNKDKGYLADVVKGKQADWSLRPNQVIAASLPYSPISDEIKGSMLEIVKEKLLTPRGLRTLSPDDVRYKGTYYGNVHQRDLAYHQGTVWPWLLGHFAEAYLKTGKENALPVVESLYDNFSPAVFEYGIGSIAEIYDGDAPHKARGAISQAWSVAELLRMRSLIATYQNRGKEKKEGSVLSHH